MDDVRARALQVALDAAQAWRDGFGGTFVDPRYPTNIEHAILDALLAAGCLRTGVERECVEACKTHYRQYPHSTLTGSGADRACDECGTAGRVALAAEAPKERWTVERINAECFRANDSARPGRWIVSFRDESDARAYAASKNKLEGER